MNDTDQSTGGVMAKVRAGLTELKPARLMRVRHEHEAVYLPPVETIDGNFKTWRLPVEGLNELFKQREAAEWEFHSLEHIASGGLLVIFKKFIVEESEQQLET